MPYAFTLDVPAIAEMYGKVRAQLPDTAKGLIAHIVQTMDGGLRYTDVWETEQDWERFDTEFVRPAVAEVLAGYGITPRDEDSTFTEIEVIDVWVGAAASRQ